MFMPQSNDRDFAPPPSGTHIAICYRVIDLGTQKQEWQGETKFYRKVLISWELPNEPMEDGRPFTISQRYTFSSSERSRLRKDLESWRGRRFEERDFGPGGFDIKNIIGKGCFLSIVHAHKDAKTYANIHSVAALPKGTETPQHKNELVYFSLEQGRFKPEVLEHLSDGLKATIKGSPEYVELVSPAHKQPRDNGDPGPAAVEDYFEAEPIPF